MEHFVEKHLVEKTFETVVAWFGDLETALEELQPEIKALRADLRKHQAIIDAQAVELQELRDRVAGLQDGLRDH